MSSASIAVTALSRSQRACGPRVRAAGRSVPQPAARHPRGQPGRRDRDAGRRVSCRWASPISEGTIGIGVDEGAWIGTAFNAATMFIGPLTVYLGALLGTRPVLLVCSGVFAIVSACLPFAHSYSVLILLMAIAGLSSGTFYPLTLSFALVNIPLRYLALTLGLVCDLYRGRA